jgi:hypothetical protein
MLILKMIKNIFLNGYIVDYEIKYEANRMYLIHF